METYEIEQAAEMLDELLDRAEAGEVIGITRDGKLGARLIPADLDDAIAASNASVDHEGCRWQPPG